MAYGTMRRMWHAVRDLALGRHNKAAHPEVKPKDFPVLWTAPLRTRNYGMSMLPVVPGAAAQPLPAPYHPSMPWFDVDPLGIAGPIIDPPLNLHPIRRAVDPNTNQPGRLWENFRSLHEQNGAPLPNAGHPLYNGGDIPKFYGEGLLNGQGEMHCLTYFTDSHYRHSSNYKGRSDPAR